MEDREPNSDRHPDDLFSKAVRAGKRTYFFDVRTTRGNDYYLTITESKKKFNSPQPGGKAFFEKHKLFLYKEDFEKFVEGLHETISEIRKVQPIEKERASYASNENNEPGSTTEDGSSSYSNIDFDDLK